MCHAVLDRGGRCFRNTRPWDCLYGRFDIFPNTVLCCSLAIISFLQEAEYDRQRYHRPSKNRRCCETSVEPRRIYRPPHRDCVPDHVDV